MLKAVIFDMDGVIIDSEPMHAKACILALKEYNIEIPIEYCFGFIGSTTYYMCQRMIKDYSIHNVTPEELLEANNKMKKSLLKAEGYSLIPHIIHLIKNLHAHNMKLIIASSSPSNAIEDVMKTFHIEQYFNNYISGMQVANPKPAPDIFLEAAKKLQLHPDECIVIEDSNNGVNAAVAAGITCIGFSNPNSGKQDLQKTTISVNSFDKVDYDFIKNVYLQVHSDL